MTSRRRSDPAGLLGDLVTVALDNDPNGPRELFELLAENAPASRIDRLRRHPQLAPEADRLASRLGNARATPELLVALASAELTAQYLDAAPRLIRDRRRQAGNAKGGKNRPPPDWHSKAISHARALLATGSQRHELTAKVARKVAQSDDAVRRVLQDAGLVHKRKTRAE